MTVPPVFVATARCVWQWEWQRLMAGLAPADKQGNYQRRATQFSGAPLAAALEAASNTAGRLCLIVGRSCPWAHRAWLLWCLRGLSDLIELVIVEPDPKAGRWVFQEPVLGCEALIDLYSLCGANQDCRATVPLLFDPGNALIKPRILNNESAELIELLNQLPSTILDAPDLAPLAYREVLTNLLSLMQNDINDGVYRCGFARNQLAYNKAEQALFAALAILDTNLTSQGPWLCGAALSLADVRLFPTLIRWEQVYAPLFGCSRAPLFSFPGLWAWRARFLALPGVAATCFPAAWRRDYFGALFPLHPSSIIPAGPETTMQLQNLVQAQIDL